MTAVLVLISGCAYGAWWLLQIGLRPVGIYTGLLLFAVILLLALLNARKKLPFLPLLRASTWLQVHIYLGWFCLFIFLLHAGLRVPGGALELTLYGVFCLVIASGVFGLFISRWLPGRMERSGEPLIFERMPAHRRSIRQSVEKLIRQAEAEAGSSTLANFYFKHLAAFFNRAPPMVDALTNRERPLHALLEELKGLIRYLNPREQEIAGEIRGLIVQKHNLDFQYASQRLLKLWLFIHIPLTYALILLGAAHGFVAMLYAGRF